MRTQKEILDRIELVKEDDMFGFEWKEYIFYLEFKHAKQFLKEDVKESDWKVSTVTGLEKIKDYMEFAYDKAYGERGISAHRSIMHMIA